MHVSVLARHGVGEARDLAERLLTGVGTRWEHSCGVAYRAAALAVTVPPADRDILVTAAWLHDIGYQPGLAATGYHQLDGANLVVALGWPRRVAALVAHHSGARFLAQAQGWAADLVTYPDERTAVSDALAYAYQTTGPRGESLSIHDRMTASLRRHGVDSPHADVHWMRGPFLLATAARVESRLRSQRPRDRDVASGSGTASGLRES